MNDVSAALWEVAAAARVGWVALHMQGDPRTMQADPHYDDVVAEVRAFLVLGRIAHDQLLSTLGERRAAFPFSHGAEHVLSDGRRLFDSYHCSRYNTNTGVLTEAMFDEVVGRAAAFIGA